MPAWATRAAVSPVIDRRDREPASREMRDEVPVAAEMLRIAVRDQDDATRFRSGRGALIEDGDAAHAGERPFRIAGHAGAGVLRTRVTASRHPR